MKQIVHDFATEIAGRREHEYNVARDKAERLVATNVYTGPTTFDVLNHWRFEVWDWQTLKTATGEQVSRSMRVTDPEEPTSCFIVTYYTLTREWIVSCPSFRKDWGETVIASVRMRVEENRRQRMVD
jgi:hypothetical protein